MLSQNAFLGMNPYQNQMNQDAVSQKQGGLNQKRDSLFSVPNTLLKKGIADKLMNAALEIGQSHRLGRDSGIESEPGDNFNDLSGIEQSDSARKREKDS